MLYVVIVANVLLPWRLRSVFPILLKNLYAAGGLGQIKTTCGLEAFMLTR